MLSRVAILVALVLALPAPAVARAPVGEPAAAGAPKVSAPSISLVQSGVLSSVSVPLQVSWSAGTAGNSPIARYQLQRRVDGKSWHSVSLPAPLAQSVTLKLQPWRVIVFRLRAIAQDDQRGSWVASAPLWLSIAQEDDAALHWSTGWQRITDRRAFGGGRENATEVGRTVTYNFVGREIGWVTQLGPRRGAAEVWVDGSLATTVDLFRSTDSRRRLAFVARWLTAGAHSIEIRTATTDVSSMVDLDAFVMLGDAVTQALVGAGDISSCSNEDDSRTAALIESVDGVVFTAGDNVYPDGRDQYFSDCYDAAWGSFKARTRPTPGNHDYYNNPGAAPYFDYFGANAGPAGVGYYSFEAGTWRVYALNSECEQVGGCAVGSPQYEWLSADLATAPHHCVMAIWHRPRFSSGAHGSYEARMAPIFNLLQQAGAELVVSGHDHDYERFAPVDADGAADQARGLRQFVVGTGGAGLYDFKATLEHSEMHSNNAHGVIRLDLSPGAYSWQFLPVAGDSFTDSGRTGCH